MKKLLLFLYSTVQWVVIIVLFLLLLVVLILENPAVPLSFAKEPLRDIGVEYKQIRGGLLSGFRIKELNYQNQVVAKEIDLKVDWERLKDRVLYIEDIKLDGIHIDKEYLSSLIDSNSSKDDNSSTKLPFDRVILKNAEISLVDIEYEKYKINSATIDIKEFQTNMKKSHKGVIGLEFDTNVAVGDLSAEIYDEHINLTSDIEPNRDFIKPYLADSNISLPSNPKFALKVSGDLKKIKYYLDTKKLEIVQNSYRVESKKLIVDGDYNLEKKDINLKLDTNLGGNIGAIGLVADAKLNLDDINSSLKFNANADIEPNRELLKPYLVDSNISLLSNPKFTLKASGGFDNINYNLDTKRLQLKQNSYRVDSDKLRVSGAYSITKKDLYVELDTKLDSNIAYLKLNGDSKLNLDDLNKTLGFNIDADILPNRSFVESLVPDKNLSIQKVAPINIVAKGDLNKTLFDIDFNGLEVKHNDLYLKVPSMALNGETKPLQGDTAFKISTDLVSTAGDGHIDDNISFNFHDINRTLHYTSKIDITAKSDYINRLLRDKNITITNRPKIDIYLYGGLNRITIKTDAQTDIKKGDFVSSVILKSKPISFDGINHSVDGAFRLYSNSKGMRFVLDSKFKGDYTNPKKLNTTTKAVIERFNDFGINLNPITPIALSIKNSKNGAWANIDSKRIKLNAKTKDYDHLIFDIKTRNLYLYKMIELPEELHHKFIKLDIKGEATISKKYIDTTGYIYSNKKFKAKLDIHNNHSGLNAKIATQHLKVIATGDIDKKDITAQLNIDSIKELQQEITKIYAFNKFDIDGPLRLKAKLKKERLWAEIYSSKLQLNGFSIERLDIDANYDKDLITLNKFSFDTAGFKNKKLNKSIYLNRKGKIYLGEKKRIDIDMHPNIRIVAKGDSSRLDGKVDIKKLPLGHPDYGSMFLSCNIDYKQRGEDKAIIGSINMKRLKLFYEPKFLNVDYDPDVVVVTKKDKRKKLQPKDDSFLKHTKIDIKIKAPQARYKTPDIDLLFDVDVRAYKEFGKDLAMLGKIKDIQGHYDQIPKRFEIEDSNIVFKGGKKINPLLDIKVKYTLPQVVIHIDIGGDANRPKLEFSSEPPMPKKDIMSYLLLGVSTNNLKSDGSLGREAELFIINQAARDLAYEFDLDRVFVKDDGTGEGYAIEVGKKIGNKNMIILESSKEGNSYIIEHDMSKNIKLRVGQHQKEHPSQSIDIYFKKRFK